jgi:hypothetical protein
MLAFSAFGNTIVTNGDFQTGDLTGWTVFTTPNGTNGNGLPDVALFYTTGEGANDAAQFNVGQVNVAAGDEGGGLRQNVSLTAGSYTFFADIAAQDTPSGPNKELGIFSVLINGVVEGTTDLGPSPGAGDTVLGVLSTSFKVPASGKYQLEILITRPYVGGLPYTPDQYLDGVAISSANSPEPSTLVLLGAGLVALLLTCTFGAAIRAYPILKAFHAVRLRFSPRRPVPAALILKGSRGGTMFCRHATEKAGEFS